MGIDLLVTGGTSFLGFEVLAQAAAAGRPTAATYLSSSPTPGPVDWHRLDITDGRAVTALLEDLRPRAVIHLAGIDSGDRIDAITDEGTGNVAHAAAGVGARLVHVSSDVVYAGDEDRPYREVDPPSPVSAYGRAKAAAEARVAEADPGAAIVRTSLILGGPSRPGKHERLVIDVLDGASPAAFFSDETRCPVAAPDLAGALLELADAEHAGPINVAGALALSRLDLARRVAAGVGRDASSLPSARAADFPHPRPRLLDLDLNRARALLRTRLRGVDEFLAT